MRGAQGVRWSEDDRDGCLLKGLARYQPPVHEVSKLVVHRQRCRFQRLAWNQPLVDEILQLFLHRQRRGFQRLARGCWLSVAGFDAMSRGFDWDVHRPECKCAHARPVGASAQPRQSLTQVMNDDDGSCSWMAGRISACLLVSSDVEPFPDGVAICWDAFLCETGRW